MDDDIKKRMRAFLADTGMTRDEFADLCGVCTGQLHKWLSTAPIPAQRQRLITRIMDETYARRHIRQGKETPDVICLNVTKKMETTATLHGLTVSEWAFSALDALSAIVRR